ncbi:hypothetical protein [Nocardia brevicatena]|uniref:hypothetical protein n=1 Tax=Nocardia brevicatena TaxID=37327 RepID=UPI0002DD5BEA|nr:hypothetical protein [Nocardia brevicatena]
MFVPVPRSETRSALLADAAFGARPDRSAAELPAAENALGTWWRAVVLGGQGRYAAARAELSELRIGTTDPVLLAVGAATEGSLLRQLGWHARAARHDGRAAALILPLLSRARPRQSRDTSGPDALEAAADALTGLAADALGTGRLELATRLLDRCATLLERNSAATRWRPLVRLGWVRAETALASGQAAQALGEAEAALGLAERSPSLRHEVKSRLLVAASTAAVGDTTRARVLAETVAQQCRDNGLLPLCWASAMLRTGLPAEGNRPSDTPADQEAAVCAAVIARRGGRFRPMATP